MEPQDQRDQKAECIPRNQRRPYPVCLEDQTEAVRQRPARQPQVPSAPSARQPEQTPLRRADAQVLALASSCVCAKQIDNRSEKLGLDRVALGCASNIT